MKFLGRLQDIFGAIPFADAGEFKTAVRMINRSKDKGAINNTDKHSSKTRKDIELVPSPSSN